MTITSPADKEALLRALEELPPEALAEVREFVEFQKYKVQAGSPATPIALRNLLKGYSFDNDLIESARAELWGRLNDESQ